MNEWWQRAAWLAGRVLAAWPRRLVVRASGEPVDLLRVETRDGAAAVMVVRRADGSELRLAEAALASRLAWNGAAAVLFLAIGAAGIAAGLTMGEPDAQRLVGRLAACVQAVPFSE